MMPVFVLVDFLDASLLWLEQHPLALLLLVAGLLACGFILLLWHNTRLPEPREPEPRKIIRMRHDTPPYGGPEYLVLVRKAQRAADDAKDAPRRILDKLDGGPR